MESAVAYLEFLTQRSRGSGLGSKPGGRRSPGSPRAEGLTIIAEFIEAPRRPQKAPMPWIWRPQLAATLAAAKSGHVS